MAVNIKYSDVSRAIIVEHGAELKSLRLLSGREIMWYADPVYWGKTSPVLFPNIGGLKDGQTIIEGRTYKIPKHGFARDYAFTPSQTANNDVTFTLESSIETMEMFPFIFTLKIRYQILRNRLKITYTVKNNEESRSMPYCIGAHPAFNVPFGNKFEDEMDTFGNYFVLFEKAENADSIKFNIEKGYFEPDIRVKGLRGTAEYKLKHSEFMDDCVFFDNLTSRSLLITRDKKTGVRVDWGGFSGLAFWTPMGVGITPAKFLCVEPWCGSADFKDATGVFSEKRGIEILKPGESKNYYLVISEISNKIIERNANIDSNS